MNNCQKSIVIVEKNNKQEIRRIFRRISYKSMKQEDIAYEA